jgi:hypothetical protein
MAYRTASAMTRYLGWLVNVDTPTYREIGLKDCTEFQTAFSN